MLHSLVDSAPEENGWNWLKKVTSKCLLFRQFVVPLYPKYVLKNETVKDYQKYH